MRCLLMAKLLTNNSSRIAQRFPSALFIVLDILPDKVAKYANQFLMRSLMPAPPLPRERRRWATLSAPRLAVDRYLWRESAPRPLPFETSLHGTVSIIHPGRKGHGAKL